VPYLSASAVVIHYEEALYQVYALLPLPFYPYSLEAVRDGKLLPRQMIPQIFLQLALSRCGKNSVKEILNPDLDPDSDRHGMLQ